MEVKKQDYQIQKKINLDYLGTLKKSANGGINPEELTKQKVKNLVESFLPTNLSTGDDRAVNVEQSRVELLNILFQFRGCFMEPEDSLLNTIEEFSRKFDVDYVLVAQELSELPGFVDIMEADCINHKYSINKPQEPISDEWTQ